MADHPAQYVPPSVLAAGMLSLETRTPIVFAGKPAVPDVTPPAPAQDRYVNRGWHAGTSKFVHWTSVGVIDTTGAQYPYSNPPFGELTDVVGVMRLPAA